MRVFLYRGIMSITVAVLLAGCATVQKTSTSPVRPAGIGGTYHRVKKGQTLWRISRIYGVDIDDITGVNRLREDAPIEIGQVLFIPRRAVSSLPTDAGTGSKTAVSAPSSAVSSASAGGGITRYAPASSSGEDFIWPMKGRIISSYGRDSNDMPNRGIDIEPRCSSDVSAARSGRVVFHNDNFGLFGKTIIIDHGDGLSSVYTNVSDVFVKIGEILARGARIARVNASGAAAGRRPYLHFEIRKAYASRNPYYYLP